MVRSLRTFITNAPWGAGTVLAELRRHVTEEWGDPEAVVTVDETGFPKKGTTSVGVKRQYSGPPGRVENCQVGVLLGHHAARGHTLLDRRRFVPDEWAAERPRRTAAGVPAGVMFRTKPELALAMVADAAAGGLPFKWVAGDGVYGDRPAFCQGVRALGTWYVLDSSADARVWTSPPEVVPPGRQPARGRAATQPKVATNPVRVDEVVAGLPASAWRRVTAAEGSQGPLIYEYAEVAVWFSKRRPPSGPERLLVRRSPGHEPEVKYHRTNAPADVPLAKVAAVRSKRWGIEQDFQNAKGECGLDKYETRGGWGGTITRRCPCWRGGSWPVSGTGPGGKKPRTDGARGAGGTPAPARRAGVG